MRPNFFLLFEAAASIGKLVEELRISFTRIIIHIFGLPAKERNPLLNKSFLPLIQKMGWEKNSIIKEIELDTDGNWVYKKFGETKFTKFAAEESRIESLFSDKGTFTSTPLDFLKANSKAYFLTLSLSLLSY